MGCIHGKNMILEAVRTSHLLIAIIWLGIQGNGAGLITDSKGFDGINSTTSTTPTSELQKDMVNSAAKADVYNGTLGTKLCLLAFFF